MYEILRKAYVQNNTYLKIPSADGRKPQGNKEF